MYIVRDNVYIASEDRMSTASALRHKHIRIDQAKLDRAKKVLRASTETETVDRALTLVVTEAEIDATLRSVGGKGKFKKLFR
jgi:hypothetical protein